MVRLLVLPYVKKKFDYGIILVESLKAESDFLDAKKIAYKHKLSPAFMEKVAQELRSVGWLESRRGLNGGYKLAALGRSATITELMDFFERPIEICPLMRNK